MFTQLRLRRSTSDSEKSSNAHLPSPEPHRLPQEIFDLIVDFIASHRRESEEWRDTLVSCATAFRSLRSRAVVMLFKEVGLCTNPFNIQQRAARLLKVLKGDLRLVENMESFTVSLSFERQHPAVRIGQILHPRYRQLALSAVDAIRLKRGSFLELLELILMHSQLRTLGVEGNYNWEGQLLSRKEKETLIAIRSMPSIKTLGLCGINHLDPRVFFGNHPSENTLDKLVLDGMLNYGPIPNDLVPPPLPSSITSAELSDRSCRLLDFMMQRLHEPSPLGTRTYPTYFPALKKLKISYVGSLGDLGAMWYFITTAKSLESLEIEHIGNYGTRQSVVESVWCLSDLGALRHLKFSTGTSDGPKSRRNIRVITEILRSAREPSAIQSLAIDFDIPANGEMDLTQNSVTQYWEQVERILTGPHFSSLRSVKINIKVARPSDDDDILYVASRRVSLEECGFSAQDIMPSLISCPWIDTDFIVTRYNL
ncbi:hypothetical protein NLJ89_g119 [Agrocybe chaxingu]|uniref:Uncharacterized protein n=1 Tax=Agrocybe chaxingu TaxID=84603 RepID=A0A9W8TFD0_9AGAR|nr:hypothetical protein NLJ89_g119 [Agrocybe chaxingu]